MATVQSKKPLCSAQKALRSKTSTLANLCFETRQSRFCGYCMLTSSLEVSLEPSRNMRTSSCKLPLGKHPSNIVWGLTPEHSIVTLQDVSDEKPLGAY